jgi:hypothetical protein
LADDRPTPYQPPTIVLGGNILGGVSTGTPTDHAPNDLVQEFEEHGLAHQSATIIWAITEQMLDPRLAFDDGIKDRPTA